MKKKKVYTILFIPEDHGKTFSIRVKKNILIYFSFSLFLFLVGVIVLICFTGIISVKLQLVHSLKSENLKLKDENRKLLLIQDKVQSIKNLREYLSRVISATSGSENTVMPVIRSVGNPQDPALMREDSLDTYLANLNDKKPEVSSATALGNEHEMQKGISPGIIPVQGWITKKYTLDNHDARNNHQGIDIAATEGSLIRSAWSGTVDNISKDRYFGLTVTIIHSSNFNTRYCHCSQVLIAKGDHVEAGQSIALVGNSGRSSGPHLHFEVKLFAKDVDPLKFIYTNSIF